MKLNHSDKYVTEICEEYVTLVHIEIHSLKKVKES